MCESKRQASSHATRHARVTAEPHRYHERILADGVTVGLLSAAAGTNTIMLVYLCRSYIQLPFPHPPRCLNYPQAREGRGI